MENINKILIVGGGASGMIAAIIAARNGAKVSIVEQMSRVGKKLLATGNGRCNITNANISMDRYHGNHVDFATDALSLFNIEKTIAFFESLGLSIREEEGGKLYPLSGQASSVLDILRYELERLGVEEICDAEVKQILQKKGEFTLILRDGSKLTANRVILAAGGRANSNLGSTGTAYKLATDFGHKLIDTYPALVQMKLNSFQLKALSGVKFDGMARVIADGKVLKCEQGEILFTEYGISGPPILQLSRTAADSLRHEKRVALRLDMFLEYDRDQIAKLLQHKLNIDQNKPIDFWLVGFVNKKLIPILLKAAGIEDIHKPCKDMKAEELERLVSLFKGWEFEVIGTQPWRDAQVTAGGIDVEDVDSKTMESKLVKGFYICGEILDIDGDCGGFNLQWAWASGYLAGMNASK